MGTNKAYELTIPVEGLLAPDNKVRASATDSVSRAVSDHVYYGKGEFDRVSYRVEVFASTTLSCDQTTDKIMEAHRLAHDFSWHATQVVMQNTIAEHIKDIVNRLYRPYFFPEETVE